MNNQNQKFTALIPLKGHSQRVPGKNLRALSGRPLYQWICRSLQDAHCVSQIVIDTDSKDVEDSVRNFDPNIKILRRPEALQGDQVSVNKLIDWQMAQLPGECFLQTHATNPLLSPKSIDLAAQSFVDDDTCDSLFAVTRHQTRMYLANGSPINHNPEELIQTQDLSPLYEENSCLYLFSRAGFSKVGRRIGATPKMFELRMPENVDIDTEDDFAYAQYLCAD